MSYILPIFVQEEEGKKGKITKEALEALKGVQLRFQDASNEEQSNVFPTIVKVECTTEAEEMGKQNTKGKKTRQTGKGQTEASKDENGIIENWTENFNAHFGIALLSTECIRALFKNAEEFLILSPVAAGNTGKDTFHIMPLDWEAKAIRNFLREACYTTPSDIIIVSNQTEGAFYKNYPTIKELFGAPDVRQPDSIKAGDFEKKKVFIILDGDVWKKVGEVKETMRKWIYTGDPSGETCQKECKDLRLEESKEILLIATSHLENWQVPITLRNQKENVHYTYPSLLENVQKVIHSFEKEFGYKPSIRALLAYTGTDIVIKTLLGAGPDYHSIRRFLTKNEYETIVLGKIGFTDEEEPFTIGKSPQDIFQIKYINKDGEYSPLNKEE